MTSRPTFAGRMEIRRYASRLAMGQDAAHDVAAFVRHKLTQQAGVRLVFAAAPSQQEMLDALVREPGIDWRRVTAFHMDEYIGLPAGAPQRFGAWLTQHVFGRLPFGAVNVIDPEPDPAACVAAYADRLAAAPIDAVCLGIGVNGHLAFNDPPVADFADAAAVKIVELDDICRQQQVDDACFARFADVPTHAVTLTIPRLLDAERLFCVVPGATKRDAVARMLAAPLGEHCPATALRKHADCVVYLDAESAP
ncbi:MAG: 6-phosphogluconolactonase [Rhodocyclaceae bacterium]